MKELQLHLEDLEQPPVLLYRPTEGESLCQFDFKTAETVTSDKKRVVLVLDGRWPETKKMFQQFPIMRFLPVLSFDKAAISQAQDMLGLSKAEQDWRVLREAQSSDQLSTIEAAVYTLTMFGETEIARQLHQLMRLFFSRYHSDRQSLLRLE